jgi:hypothetical protein
VSQCPISLRAEHPMFDDVYSGKQIRHDTVFILEMSKVYAISAHTRPILSNMWSPEFWEMKGYYPREHGISRRPSCRSLIGALTCLILCLLCSLKLFFVVILRTYFCDINFNCQKDFWTMELLGLVDKLDSYTDSICRLQLIFCSV